jgi:hypothetical protein
MQFLIFFNKNLEKRLIPFSIKIFKLAFKLDFVSDFIFEK